MIRPSEITLIPEKTCSVTGHRKVNNDLDVERLKRGFLYVIERGYDTFLTGCAVGFDTICYKILKEIRKEKDIKIIGCIPCLNQDARFSDLQKKEYREMLDNLDEKILISEKYTPACMNIRNKYMVDNSTVTFSYLRENYGGTFNTVGMAKKKGNTVYGL